MNKNYQINRLRNLYPWKRYCDTCGQEKGPDHKVSTRYGTFDACAGTSTERAERAIEAKLARIAEGLVPGSTVVSAQVLSLNSHPDSVATITLSNGGGQAVTYKWFHEVSRPGLFVAGHFAKM